MSIPRLRAHAPGWTRRHEKCMAQQTAASPYAFVTYERLVRRNPRKRAHPANVRLSNPMMKLFISPRARSSPRQFRRRKSDHRHRVRPGRDRQGPAPQRRLHRQGPLAKVPGSNSTTDACSRDTRICGYLEGLFPEPTCSAALRRAAFIEMTIAASSSISWRDCELHPPTHPDWPTGAASIADFGASKGRRCARWRNGSTPAGKHAFMVGERFTIADITPLCDRICPWPDEYRRAKRPGQPAGLAGPDRRTRQRKRLNGTERLCSALVSRLDHVDGGAIREVNSFSTRCFSSSITSACCRASGRPSPPSTGGSLSDSTAWSATSHSISASARPHPIAAPSGNRVEAWQTKSSSSSAIRLRRSRSSIRGARERA